MRKRVAFQGIRGAYSELCCIECFGKEIETVPCSSFDEMFDLLEKEKVDFVVLPVENCVEGPVVRAHELLVEREGFTVVGEHYLRVRHCLIANPEDSIDGIKFVVSHPQALGQCGRFIKELGFKEIPFYDTAASVIEIKGKRGYAAIASRLAAEIYGMKVLMEGIEDCKVNETRFFIISRKCEVSGNKHSIVFKTLHKPGALCNVLEVFKERKINLTRLISMPDREKPWHYIFFLDFIYEGDVKEVLGEVRKRCVFLKHLGSYDAEKV